MSCHTAVAVATRRKDTFEEGIVVLYSFGFTMQVILCECKDLNPRKTRSDCGGFASKPITMKNATASINHHDSDTTIDKPAKE